MKRVKKPDSLTPFLHVALHKVLGVFLENFVDFVQKVVELVLELLAALSRRGDLGLLFDPLFGGRSLLALLLGHVRSPSVPGRLLSTLCAAERPGGFCSARKRAGQPIRPGSLLPRTTL